VSDASLPSKMVDMKVFYRIHNMYNKYELKVVKVSVGEVTGYTYYHWKQKKFYEMIYASYVLNGCLTDEHVISSASMLYAYRDRSYEECIRLVRSAVMMPSYDNTYGVCCTETNEMFRCVSNVEQLENAIAEKVVICADVKNFKNNIRGKTSHLGGATLFVFDGARLRNRGLDQTPPFYHKKYMLREEYIQDITDDMFIEATEKLKSIIREHDFTKTRSVTKFISELAQLKHSPVLDLVKPDYTRRSLEFMTVDSEMISDMIFTIFRSAFMMFGADKIIIRYPHNGDIMTPTLCLILLACELDR